MNRRVARVFVISPAVALLGIAWIAIATNHFSSATGRPIYGLAGNHYSLPDWGFKYEVDGERIERIAVTVPTVVSLVALLLCGVLSTASVRQSGIRAVVLVWLVHLLSAVVLLAVAGWTWVNILGVFI